jgi:protocatechuate 3,4-dioxygenase alpha subunit
VVEIWQADAAGNYGQKPFRGFGRSATDDQGAFRFQTIKPGRVPGPDGKLQAPHIAVNVFMRGLLKQLVTRMYFPDDASNAADGVLARVPQERRGTLVAKPAAGKPGKLEWNVVLQGRDETVFFDC